MSTIYINAVEIERKFGTEATNDVLFFFRELKDFLGIGGFELADLILSIPEEEFKALVDFRDGLELLLEGYVKSVKKKIAKDRANHSEVAPLNFDCLIAIAKALKQRKDEITRAAQLAAVSPQGIFTIQ